MIIPTYILILNNTHGLTYPKRKFYHLLQKKDNLEIHSMENYLKKLFRTRLNFIAKLLFGLLDNFTWLFSDIWIIDIYQEKNWIRNYTSWVMPSQGYLLKISR